MPAQTRINVLCSIHTHNVKEFFMDKNVALLLASGFEEAEAIITLDIL